MSDHRLNFENLPDWLSPVQVCQYLKLGRSTVYELIRSGQIYSRKFGRLLRVPKSALHPSINDSPAKARG